MTNPKISNEDMMVLELHQAKIDSAAAELDSKNLKMQLVISNLFRKYNLTDDDTINTQTGDIIIGGAKRMREQQAAAMREQQAAAMREQQAAALKVQEKQAQEETPKQEIPQPEVVKVD